MVYYESRIVDIQGYEYRSNMAGIGAGLTGTAFANYGRIRNDERYEKACHHVPQHTVAVVQKQQQRRKRLKKLVRSRCYLDQEVSHLWKATALHPAASSGWL